MLNTAARNYFYMLEVLNRIKNGSGNGNGNGNGNGDGDGSGSMRRVKSFARRWKHRVTAGDPVTEPGGQVGE